MKSKATLDTYADLLVQRYGAGIRLIKPGSFSTNYPIKTSIRDLMQLSLNFYFMDCNSFLKKVNDQTASSCGYLSESDAVGRSIREVSKKETAARILNNDNRVIQTKALKIMDETHTCLNELDVTAISLKFPWFNENDQVIGILGCSILTGQGGKTSIADSLAQLIQCGLLAPSVARSDSILPGLHYKEIYLDKCDKNILYFLVRGKTAKEIGRILNLSHRTIEHRLEKIKIKLQVSSKSELIDRIIDDFIR